MDIFAVITSIIKCVVIVTFYYQIATHGTSLILTVLFSFQRATLMTMLALFKHNSIVFFELIFTIVTFIILVEICSYSYFLVCHV